MCFTSFSCKICHLEIIPIWCTNLKGWRQKYICSDKQKFLALLEMNWWLLVYWDNRQQGGATNETHSRRRNPELKASLTHGWGVDWYLSVILLAAVRVQLQVWKAFKIELLRLVITTKLLKLAWRESHPILQYSLQWGLMLCTDKTSISTMLHRVRSLLDEWRLWIINGQ